jgi:hypothetical protein
MPGLISDFGRDLTNNFGVIYDYPNRLVVGIQDDDVQVVARFFQPRRQEGECAPGTADLIVLGFRLFGFLAGSGDLLSKPPCLFRRSRRAPCYTFKINWWRTSKGLH